MLFQASDEKSEPVCDDADRHEQAEARGGREARPTIGVGLRGVQKSPKFALTAAAFQPQISPTTIRASRAPVFAVVKTFWMNLP